MKFLFLPSFIFFCLLVLCYANRDAFPDEMVILYCAYYATNGRILSVPGKATIGTGQDMANFCKVVIADFPTNQYNQLVNLKTSATISSFYTTMQSLIGPTVTRDPLINSNLYKGNNFNSQLKQNTEALKGTMHKLPSGYQTQLTNSVANVQKIRYNALPLSTVPQGVTSADWDKWVNVLNQHISFDDDAYTLTIVDDSATLDDAFNAALSHFSAITGMSSKEVADLVKNGPNVQHMEIVDTAGDMNQAIDTINSVTCT